jgi:WD40 repeat protein
VKAIGWCPSNPSLLASGGGTADRHIRFFSTQTLNQNFCIDTGKYFFIQALKYAISFFRKYLMK